MRNPVDAAETEYLFWIKTGVHGGLRWAVNEL